MCGCCVSECNAMEADPDFRGPAALAKGMRFVGDPRDETSVERLNELNDEHGIWDCTRCYFCNERCPKGVDPRDAIAKLGAESVKEGIDWDMGVKHAKWFVTSTKTTGWLRETDLVPKTQGILGALKETKFALQLAAPRQGAAARPDPRRGRRRRGAQALQPRQGAGPRRRAGIVQGEAALAKIEHIEAERGPRRKEETPSEGRLLQGLSRLAVGEGARHVHAGAGAEARDRARRAGVGHLLRRGRHPRGRARLLPAPERADPGLRRGDRRGHADDDLQRLHAQPAPGELAAEERRRAARPREREPRDSRRAAVQRQRGGQAPALADRRGRRLRPAEAGRAQGAQGPQGGAVLRLPDPASVEAPRLRGSGQAALARGDHRRVRGRGDRLSRPRSSAAASRSSRPARRPRSASCCSRSSRRPRPAPT